MDNNQNEKVNVNGILDENTGANYKEAGSEPRHVDTSTLDSKKKTSPVKIAVLVLIIILFGVWAFIIYGDFNKVKAGDEPTNCFFGKNTVQIEGKGSIEECYGLGYKVVKYQTLDAKMTEFVPIWEKTKSIDILEEK